MESEDDLDPTNGSITDIGAPVVTSVSGDDDDDDDGGGGGGGGGCFIMTCADGR